MRMLFVNVLPLVGAALVANSPGTATRYTFAAPYDQSFLEGYSILKHVGGLGPYSNRVANGVGRDPPDGCAVDQVIMLRRHGERYPQAKNGPPIKGTLAKMRTSNTTYTGDLSFFPGWNFYIPDDGLYEMETESGPYNGLLTSYKHGAEYKVRYGHLWNASSSDPIPVWTGEFERVVQTARKFGEGFFGWNYTNVVALNLIPETEDQGANSLTPRCPADNQTMCNNLTFIMPIFKIAAQRLNTQNKGLSLNESNVYNLMMMSAFELNVRGYSDWTDVFSQDEWLSFGYTQDLQFYYCAGPGNEYMNAVGGVYLNASLSLMKAGPKKSRPLVLNFSHDTNITPILAALGIGNPAEHLTLHRIPFPNTYSTGDLMPMGGHLTFERMTCNATATSDDGVYVRVVLNEAIVPFTSCQDGPGYSCALGNYSTIVNKVVKDNDYTDKCAINATWPQHVSFWWDYNTTMDYTSQKKRYIPYQGSSVV